MPNHACLFKCITSVLSLNEERVVCTFAQNHKYLKIPLLLRWTKQGRVVAQNYSVLMNSNERKIMYLYFCVFIKICQILVAASMYFTPNRW